MRLRSSLGFGVVVSCTLTTLTITAPGAFAATAGMAAAVAPGATVVRTQPSVTGTGYDVSWPNCEGGGATATLPGNAGIAVVGVDDGHPFSRNPCLQAEAAWAADAPESGQYMVLDSPIGWTSAHVQQYADHGPAGDCGDAEFICQSYNWGYNAAIADLRYANEAGATSPQWWLDVELPTSGRIDQPGPDCYKANLWVCDPNDNSMVVQAAVTALASRGKTVGIYSDHRQWSLITGGLTLGLPTWIAGYDTAPAAYCDPDNAGRYWFGGGTPMMIQSAPTTFDPDSDC